MNKYIGCMKRQMCFLWHYLANTMPCNTQSSLYSPYNFHSNIDRSLKCCCCQCILLNQNDSSLKFNCHLLSDGVCSAKIHTRACKMLSMVDAVHCVHRKTSHTKSQTSIQFANSCYFLALVSYAIDISSRNNLQSDAVPYMHKLL